MHLRLKRHSRLLAAPVAVAILFASLGALTGCGTMGSFGGGTNNGGTQAGENPVSGLWSGGNKNAAFPGFTKKAGPNDRPTRVGWLSARASRCGFVFDPAQLRARYFAFEQSYGADSRRMHDIQRAYDYSLESTAAGAKEDANYCTKERVDEIRPELNRYLTGDFRTF